MRKNLNAVHIEGYVYDCSKLSLRTTGANSKNPNTEYFSGDLEIATDEEGLNVVPVHFTYVTEFYSKSGKANNTFTNLKAILNNPNGAWVSGGKDDAMKVSISGSLALNDFYSADDQRVSQKRIEGSFLNIVNSLNPVENERNKFQCDMVINKVNRVAADEEKNIKEDYVTVGGAIFNFRNDLLPFDFKVKSVGGMEFFEDLGVTNAEPVYTKVWGHYNNQTIKVERTEESAFGESAVAIFERKSKEWVITGTSRVPYEYGENGDLTVEELNNAQQNREVHWAEIKKRNDEYLASKNNAVASSSNKSTAPAIKAGEFLF